MVRGVMALSCIGILFLMGCGGSDDDDDQKSKSIVIAKTVTTKQSSLIPHNDLVTLSDDVVDPNNYPASKASNPKHQGADTEGTSMLTLQQLALNGNVRDQINYAQALLKKSSPYFDRIAFYWTQQAAQHKDPEATFMLAYLYYAGIGTPVNYNKAHDLLIPLAKAHVPEAQFYIAKIYYEGLGVKKDLSVARKWISMAVKQRLPEAQNLANQIFSASDEPEDQDKSLQQAQQTTEYDNNNTHAVTLENTDSTTHRKGTDNFTVSQDHEEDEGYIEKVPLSDEPMNTPDGTGLNS